MELAGRGRGAQAVRPRGRSVRGRPAPRHRHRRSHGSRGARSGCRDRLLRGTSAAPGALPDDPYRRRLLRDPGSPWIGRPPGRHRGRRERRRRHDRAERRAGMARAVRPPRYPADRRPERVPRPAFAATQAAAGVRAPAGQPTSASASAACFEAAGADRLEAEVGRGPAAASSNAGVELEDARPRPTARDAANADPEPPGRGSTRDDSSAGGSTAPGRCSAGVGSQAALACPCDGAYRPCRRARARAAHATGGGADDRRSRAAGPEDDTAWSESTHRRVASRRGVRGSACGFHPRLQAAVPARGGAETCPYH